jgi:hypothetical protein
METQTLQSEFDKYFSYPSLADLAQDEQVDSLGQLVDLSFDLNRIDGVEKAIALSTTIEKDKLSPTNYIVFHYDLANAWNVLRKLKRAFTPEDWLFEQEEINNEIINSRIALNHPDFKTIQLERQCQILTNLGSLFSYIGRFIEAQECWNRAIATIPKFAMALANKGYGLVSYARLQHENVHRNIFINLAYHFINKGLSLRQYMDPAATNYFEKAALELSETMQPEILNVNIDLNTASLGVDDHEIEYRKWCLNNTLFLHPVNDVTQVSYAAYDCLMIPPILTKMGDPPIYHNFYNQIKQEFVSARYFLFEGIEKQSKHLADKDVILTNTNEMLAYSLNLEKVKIAYRISYAIFDKIAYYLNSYLNLMIPEKKVNFRTIWYSKNKDLRNEISQSNNWPLRGLYWLSKDLFDETLKDTIDPDAKDLADLRNFMEHKSLRIKQFDYPDSPFHNPDQISYTISRNDLESKTLKLLKLSRSAIFYLTYAISQAEFDKSSNIETSKAHSFPFSIYPDDYKV